MFITILLLYIVYIMLIVKEQTTNRNSELCQKADIYAIANTGTNLIYKKDK